MYNQTEVLQDLFLSKQRSVRNSENKGSDKNLHRTHLTINDLKQKMSFAWEISHLSQKDPVFQTIYF